MRIIGISREYRDDEPTRHHSTAIPSADEAYIEMDGGKEGPIRFKLEMRRGKLVVTAASSIALSLRPLTEHGIIIGESGSKQLHPHIVICPVCNNSVEARHGRIRLHDWYRPPSLRETCAGSDQEVKDFNPFAALDLVSREERNDG